jgi:hypothetical protein
VTSHGDAVVPGGDVPTDAQKVAGSIAHDLNNLLSVVRNYASFIVDESAEAALGPEGERWRTVHRDAQQIEIAVERALLIVAERIQPLAESG